MIGAVAFMLKLSSVNEKLVLSVHTRRHHKFCILCLIACLVAFAAANHLSAEHEYETVRIGWCESKICF
jgi:hypothetical protein